MLEEAKNQWLKVIAEAEGDAIACSAGLLLPCFSFPDFESCSFLCIYLNLPPFPPDLQSWKVWPEGPAIACHGRAVLRGAVNGVQENIVLSLAARCV